MNIYFKYEKRSGNEDCDYKGLLKGRTAVERIIEGKHSYQFNHTDCNLFILLIRKLGFLVYSSNFWNCYLSTHFDWHNNVAQSIRSIPTVLNWKLFRNELEENLYRKRRLNSLYIKALSHEAIFSCNLQRKFGWKRNFRLL